MITGKAIISYLHLWEASPNPSGALKFSCSLLFDKANVKDIADLEAQIEKAKEKGKGSLWANKIPSFRYQPLRDGDAELASGEKTDPTYKGKFFLNASADTAPGVVGPDAKPLLDRNKLYAGCIVRADVNPFPYKNSGNCGIGWGLNNVMLIADGERLDGRMNAEDAFAGFVASEDNTGELL